MRIKVDAERCQGHGRCNALAPEVYPLDDNGYCAVVAVDVARELETEAQHGADACPERAITVER